MTRVTLLTDFGTRDGYVAAMKGVLASLAPEARLLDVAHDLDQGDVEHARWVLGRYWRLFPPGTVHLVVVDPGVGTERKALALEADGRFVVAPDNGVVSRVLDEAGAWRAVEVREDPDAPGRSATFHGRDVFAPAAGRLASGRRLEELGAHHPEPVRIHEARPRPLKGGGYAGQVISVDRFGNLITNVPGDLVGERAIVELGDRKLELVTTYGDVEPGELLSLVSSDGRVEVAVRDGSAARMLGVGRGGTVVVRPRS